MFGISLKLSLIDHFFTDRLIISSYYVYSLMDLVDSFFEELGKGKRFDDLSSFLLEEIKIRYKENNIDGIRDLLKEIHIKHLGGNDEN